MSERFYQRICGMNYSILSRHGEVYAFCFDDKNLDKMIRKLGELAQDPEIKFNDYDGAILMQDLRRISCRPDYKRFLV